MPAASARLEFRVLPERKSRMERAAELVHEPASEFARTAAEEKAERVIREHEGTTTVPAEFFDDLLDALDSPPRHPRPFAPSRSSCQRSTHSCGKAGARNAHSRLTVSLRSELLDPERHDVREFSCGEPSLDAWLREQAAPSAAGRTARTWVWVDENGCVVGCDALAAHKVLAMTFHAMSVGAGR